MWLNTVLLASVAFPHIVGMYVYIYVVACHIMLWYVVAWYGIVCYGIVWYGMHGDNIRSVRNVCNVYNVSKGMFCIMQCNASNVHNICNLCEVCTVFDVYDACNVSICTSMSNKYLYIYIRYIHIHTNSVKQPTAVHQMFMYVAPPSAILPLRYHRCQLHHWHKIHSRRSVWRTRGQTPVVGPADLAETCCVLWIE